MYRVLIACFDNWNTMAEVPYILKKAGFEIDILCGKKSWLRANRFYDKWILAEENDKYIQQLVNLAKNTNYDWILPGDEKLIKILNETIDDETLFYKLLPLTKIENREVLSSKNGFSHVCQKYGIRTPNYLSYKITDDGKAYLSNMQFPIIIKVDFSWGGKNIKICSSVEEADIALSGFPKGENVILQEFIAGKEVPVEALFWKGELIAVACSEILDYDKDKFSYSTRRRYMPVDNVLRAEVERFGVKVGVHGFVNMAYILSSANNSYYAIEADIRPSSWGAYIGHVGSSFSTALTCAMKGTENVQEFRPLEVALFHKDIRRALYKHDIKGLLRWIYNFSYWKFFPFYDYKLTARIFSELWQEFIAEKMQRARKSIDKSNRRAEF